MKVCPVCNETFADELKFCDLDGTRLKREVGTESPQKQNKAWSLIGVGLLVGALVLSALSIIFLPKARIAPTVANSETGQAITSTPADSAQGQIADAGAADSESPEILVEELPATESKKKDADKSLVNANVSGATPDPKAAAKETSEDETTAGQFEPPIAPPPPVKEPEPAPAVKPASDTRDAEATAKPASSAEMKRDQKKSKDDDDKKSDKKGDEKKKKKGGGLFGAFKKIFGKD
jgi:cell division septation protein DedD